MHISKFHTHGFNQKQIKNIPKKIPLSAKKQNLLLAENCLHSIYTVFGIFYLEVI